MSDRFITFTPSEGTRTKTIFAPLALGVSLIPPSVGDGVHWTVTYEGYPSVNASNSRLVDTEAEGLALIAEWKNKVT